MKIREFYLETYPTDDLGLELNETPTFAGLLNQLIIGGDVYRYIGVSQNQSPTCRARLVSVGKSNCIFESVPSPYDKFPKPEFVGVKYKVPNWIAWNSFFY